MEFFMGGIIMFGGNFSPRDWAFCNGQLISINQNQALYAILGTTWGGDARTNFALPDFRGRAPIGFGRGIGLTEAHLGQKRGSETHTLNIAELPAHSHTATFTPTTGTGGSGSGIQATATATMNIAGAAGDLSNPSNNYLAEAPALGLNAINSYSATKGSGTLATDAIDVTVTVTGGGGGISGGTVNINQTGGSKQFALMPPNLGMAYIIALQGTFPSRN